MSKPLFGFVSRSIARKLWLTIIGVVIFVLAILSVYLEQYFDTYFYSLQEQNLESRASLIANVYTSWPNGQLAILMAKQLADDEHAFVLFTGPPTTDFEAASILRQLTNSEKAQLEHSIPVARRGATFGLAAVGFGPDSLTVVQSLYDRGNLVGFVLLNQSQQVTNQPIQRIRELIYISLALGVVLTTGLAFVVSKNLSRPLVQMNRAVGRMVRGDFHSQVKVVTHDEVGRLGETFNKLAKELEQNIEELSREKEQLSGIISSMVDGVVSADLDARVVLANPPARRWLRTLGLSEHGVAEDHTLPNDLKQLESMVVSERTTQQAWMDWQGRHVLVTMTPLYDRQQAIRGVVAIIRDMTEEHRLDRLRKDFVANVSHELRTPLSMMQGYSEALLDEFGDDPEQRKELARIILDEAHRMRRLVNDLLDLAQLESGQFQLNIGAVNMGDLVRKMARKFSTLANERQVGLVTDMTYSGCIVHGDADRLEQVFTNLLDNALRHTPEGGQVTLSLRDTSDGVNVTISDTGSGIPQEDLPFIWERFYKVDKARTRSRGGTGLGLSIAKNIIAAHHGDIFVDSELNRGTTFSVSLPRSMGSQERGILPLRGNSQ